MATFQLVVVYHPPPGHVEMADLPASYRLSSSELHAALPGMVGAPVTVEHLGVEQASSRIPGRIDHTLVSAQLMASENPAHRRVGVVLDAWEGTCGAFWATLEIIGEPMPGLLWMIRSKQLGSVSLTHTMFDGAVVPLEVALVGVPARPQCTIRHMSACPLATAQYKARTLDGRETAMSDPASVVPATCETALASMSPAMRELIVARLEHLAAATTKAVEKSGALEAELKASKWAAETDNQLLASQLTQLINGMDADSLANFSLTVPSTLEAYKSGDASQILNASLRTIMCANQHLMLMRNQAADLPPATKRARVEAPPEAAAPAAEPAASVPMQSMNKAQLLEAALFTQFET